MPAYADFVQKYPAYDRTHDIDELRGAITPVSIGSVRSTWTTQGAGCTLNHSFTLIRNCSPRAS